MNKLSIKQLPLDLDKRHLIIGDIHGQYDKMLQLLNSADYDSDHDIIYTVGDMIDRGPKSYEVFDFFTSLNNKNTYTIMGNHEYMAQTPYWKDVWLRNGGVKCIASLSDNGKDVQWLNQRISYLPWIIEVGEPSDDKAFRLVHGEYPPEWDDQKLHNVIRSATNGEDRDIARIIWGRETIDKIISATNKLQIPEINISEGRNMTTFLGHSSVRKITRYKNDLVYLDTFAGRSLSMTDAISGEEWSVSYD